MPTRLLIIEDDPALREMLSLHFEDQGMQVSSAATCAQAREQAGSDALDLILLDQQLPDGLGIDLLPELLNLQPGVALIMMTGQHGLELAIEAIKLGAAEFIHKPIQTAALQQAVEKALARRQPDATECPPPELPKRDLIGRSAAMLEVSKQIALAAGSTASVLIHGESGTGKEVVARLIHQHSGRSGAFVALNCAAIVDTLLESELFGHEKGAFTGADRQKAGKFELADKGTLFLDEVAELALPLQAKLLRTLQERVVERVGGSATIPVDVRIIAASHRALFQQVEQGAFREDLAYRLKVIDIQPPPARTVGRHPPAGPVPARSYRREQSRLPAPAVRGSLRQTPTARLAGQCTRTREHPHPGAAACAWRHHTAGPHPVRGGHTGHGQPPRATIRRHPCAASMKSRRNISSMCWTIPVATRAGAARSSASPVLRWTARSASTVCVSTNESL